MRRFAVVWVLVALCFVPVRALACGVMVSSEESGARMRDQQVLIAEAKDRTIVVVSVGYAGAGTDFAFLLPLQAEPLAIVEGEPKFFETLEEQTTPRVEIVDDTAEPPSSGGCGCLGGAGMAKAPGGGAAEEVRVIQRGETTTYQYAVVGGSSGSSVADWLEKEKFSPPADVQADLDNYLARHWVFLAARLKPQADTGALAPIEIHYEKMAVAELQYPFWLSRRSLGASAKMGIDLYLVGDPFLPENYAVHRVEAAQLKALSPKTSNYQALADQALSGGAFLLQAGYLRRPAIAVFNSGTPVTANRDPAPLSRTYIRYFGGEVNLIRLHAELGASELQDVKFEAASGPEVELDPVMMVHWGAKSPSASLFGVLFGFALLRRRVRRTCTRASGR